MTVRIDPTLLAALRQRAKRSGRSVSAEVVDLLRRELQPVAPRKPRRTMGMFATSDFEVPDLEDFKQLRRDMSKRLAMRFASTT